MDDRVCSHRMGTLLMAHHVHQFMYNLRSLHSSRIFQDWRVSASPATRRHTHPPPKWRFLPTLCVTAAIDAVQQRGVCVPYLRRHGTGSENVIEDTGSILGPAIAASPLTGSSGHTPLCILYTDGGFQKASHVLTTAYTPYFQVES